MHSNASQIVSMHTTSAGDGYALLPPAPPSGPDVVERIEFGGCGLLRFVRTPIRMASSAAAQPQIQKRHVMRYADRTTTRL